MQARPTKTLNIVSALEDWEGLHLTKCVLLSYSGHAYAEDVNTYKQWIQLEGGDYLVSQDSVRCDIKHEHDPVMVVKQGICGSEDDATIQNAVITDDKIKLHGQAILRDKMWTRRLFAAMWKLFYVMTVFVTSFSVYTLIWVFAWAWFHVWLPI